MEDTKTMATENMEQPRMENTSFSRSKGGTSAHLGDKIRAIRKTQGMKQETLAEIVKVTQSKISAIESTGEIDSRTFKKIADALEVSVDFIKRFEPEEAVYQVQNNYNAQQAQIGYEFEENTTNSLDVIKYMADAIEKSYHLIIAEQKKIINELKAENLELKTENKELRTKK